jgi:toxin ParE1/3/4
MVVEWTLQAIEDIDNIAGYIALQSNKFAAVQVQRFFDKVDILITQPKIGRMVPELKQRSIRELILGNYRIIYRIVSTDRIHILTVHHTAMKLNRKRFK